MDFPLAGRGGWGGAGRGRSGRAASNHVVTNLRIVKNPCIKNPGVNYNLGLIVSKKQVDPGMQVVVGFDRF